MIYDIYMEKPTQDYYDIWAAAGNHLGNISQGSIGWIKSDPTPPFLENLSFRLGNQIFFVRLEDVDNQIRIPGNIDGLFTIAEGYKSTACILPMKKVDSEWRPAISGWGLIDAATQKPFNPVNLVSEENIEMTQWELQDFAVQIVRNYLTDAGFEIMSYNSHPGVNPSIWFMRNDFPEWVIVNFGVFPQMEVEPSANLDEIKNSVGMVGCQGNLANVFVAAEAEMTNLTDSPIPLYRGHALSVRFEGLEPLG